MEKILLIAETISSDEWNNECDLCVIPFTMEYLNSILEKMEDVKNQKGKDLLWSAYFDYSPTWFPYSEEIEEVLWKEEFTFVTGNDVEKAERKADEDRIRMEGSTLCVGQDSFWFEAYIKHTSVKMCTPGIRNDTITALKNLLKTS
jgi:hypothetical protein